MTLDLSRLGSRQTFWLASAVLIAVYLVDAVTPTRMSFYLFYFIPLSLTAYRSGTVFTWIMTALCALAWVGANASTIRHDGIAIYCWNAAIRTLTFVYISGLILKLAKEHEDVRQAHEQMRWMFQQEKRHSRLDALTQVANTRGFKEELTEEVERCRRFGHPLSLLYLDIDKFKTLNDTHGHLYGDEVLTGVAGALKKSVRSVDMIGRLGGDEFIVLLPETPKEGAEACARKVLECVRKDTGLSVSVGTASYTGTYPATDEMIRRADNAMYQAKKAGGHRVWAA